MTVTVSLSPELETFLEKKVESGEFASPGDVLVAALRLLQERDSLNAVSPDALRLAWTEGLASGDFQPLDLATLKAEARRQHQSKS
ncbi:MAG: type II toxin-antitoxin system ParD family antitoxin [Rhizobium sp.]|nr:type II toxin-antitoxin system ParD family antitoxin [Rhizobium sp.]MBW8322934.1 type II toxin-antitoxin system ParD family antitoxin [Rhizobium sp.]MBW8444155.1 type II toxin-antitoxin system ParD family antitoxin [Arenimonas sp.]